MAAWPRSPVRTELSVINIRSSTAAAGYQRPACKFNISKTDEVFSRHNQLLFSPKRRTKPGPKGPDADIVRAVVEIKQRNPTWGCPRIADQINLAFGTSIDK